MHSVRLLRSLRRIAPNISKIKFATATRRVCWDRVGLVPNKVSVPMSILAGP